MSRRDLPMDYIRTALNRNERIVHVARFHWFYDVVSWFWLFIGVMLTMGVLYGASRFVMHIDMGRAFPDIEDGDKPAAMDKIYNHYGGWIGLLGDLHWLVKVGALFCLLWGVSIFASRTVIKYTTEIAVTTQRLIFKRGIVSRFVGEMKLDRMESINVYQSFFGRIFNYGRVMAHGVGVGEVLLPEVEDPMKLRRALDYARQKMDEERSDRAVERLERAEERDELPENDIKQ